MFPRQPSVELDGTLPLDCLAINRNLWRNGVFDPFREADCLRRHGVFSGRIIVQHWKMMPGVRCTIRNVVVLSGYDSTTSYCYALIGPCGGWVALPYSVES